MAFQNSLDAELPPGGEEWEEIQDEMKLGFS